jgi:hypothetical protein
MANKSHKSSGMATLSLRHRAICEEGDYKGQWRDNVSDAYGDASSHQNGHRDHEISVVTEQTVKMKFDPANT